MKQETQGSGAEMKACQVEGAALHRGHALHVDHGQRHPAKLKQAWQGRQRAGRRAGLFSQREAKVQQQKSRRKWQRL